MQGNYIPRQPLETVPADGHLSPFGSLFFVALI